MPPRPSEYMVTGSHSRVVLLVRSVQPPPARLNSRGADASFGRFYQRNAPQATAGGAFARGLLEELAGHDDALDLVGALVDLGDFGVAHHAFCGEVAGVAVAAEELDGVG